jgi:hypothetical protein
MSQGQGLAQLRLQPMLDGSVTNGVLRYSQVRPVTTAMSESTSADYDEDYDDVSVIFTFAYLALSTKRFILCCTRVKRIKLRLDFWLVRFNACESFRGKTNSYLCVWHYDNMQVVALCRAHKLRAAVLLVRPSNLLQRTAKGTIGIPSLNSTTHKGRRRRIRYPWG